jgi:hypothetical protein
MELQQGAISGLLFEPVIQTALQNAVSSAKVSVNNNRGSAIWRTALDGDPGHNMSNRKRLPERSQAQRSCLGGPDSAGRSSIRGES